MLSDKNNPAVMEYLIDRIPYIGITGVDNGKQAIRLIDTFQNKPITLIETHRLMLGVLVTYKTLSELPSGEQSLSKKQVKEIYDACVGSSSGIMFALHYHTKASIEEIRPEIRESAGKIVNMPLSAQVRALFSDIYKDYEDSPRFFLLGVQLNVTPLPDPCEIINIKKDFPKLNIILQLTNPLDGAKMKAYGNYADNVLVDASGGLGIAFDFSKSTRAYHDISAANPYLRVGFAGGMSDENVEANVTALKNCLRTKAFSIDAQGKLRTEGKLDLKKAENYIVNSVRAFKSG